MEQFLFIGEVTHYNDSERKEISKKVVVRAHNFVEAVQRIEDWYGNELVYIQLQGVEDQLITICDECYERLLKGDFE